MNRYGSVWSWLYDGIAAGLGLALCSWGYFIAIVILLTQDQGDIPWRLVALRVTLTVAGGCLLGAPVAVVGWWLASSSRILALVAGTLGTSFSTLAVAQAVMLISEGESLAPLQQRLAFLFGAIAALPVGTVYIAVREKGRSGMAPLLAGVLWIPFPVALTTFGLVMLS